MPVVNVQGESSAPAVPTPSGPNYPGTVASQVNGGTAWTGLTNLTADDASYAVCNMGATGFTQNLRASNFGFAIPAGATINGITVEVKRKGGPLNGSVGGDAGVFLLKAGSAGGTDKSGGFWSTVETTIIYGSASDLWGRTWTPADINATTFGLYLQALDNGDGNAVASVNFIRITVTYTAG